MKTLQFAFIGITLLSLVLFFLGTGKDKKVLIFFSLWAVFIAVLSYSGFFLNTETLPPRMLLVIVPAIFYTIYFYKKIEIAKVKRNVLVAIHIVRLPVEITLYQLFLHGKVPVIMTYEGWNFDIVIGLSAIMLVFYLAFVKRNINKRLLRIWNILGIGFLTVIVMIAILSLPSPIQQLAHEQPNVAILEFPFTLLPAVVVPIVLLSHLLILKENR
ncbi:hypothetical protein JKA74_19110 [Marivirga sp. S37H4]|uniref:Uncharacterized protein n=1 Tax=Marivirga aurantiaca TaxID=2802615 RepID=A0A935CC25_9BACT|nr:hypothetical protein [Marivirga aurantiaca]MBK6267162.1 hypothetical protein [Marivirga aurantiaca]